jgi:hypothetical protein
MPADRPFLPQIEATHYPYKIGSDELDLLGQNIRDADLAQAAQPSLDSSPGLIATIGLLSILPQSER